MDNPTTPKGGKGRAGALEGLNSSCKESICEKAKKDNNATPSLLRKAMRRVTGEGPQGITRRSNSFFSLHGNHSNRYEMLTSPAEEQEQEDSNPTPKASRFQATRILSKISLPAKPSEIPRPSSFKITQRQLLRPHGPPVPCRPLFGASESTTVLSRYSGGIVSDSDDQVLLRGAGIPHSGNVQSDREIKNRSRLQPPTSTSNSNTMSKTSGPTAVRSRSILSKVPGHNISTLANIPRDLGQGCGTGSISQDKYSASSNRVSSEIDPSDFAYKNRLSLSTQGSFSEKAVNGFASISAATIAQVRRQIGQVSPIAEQEHTPSEKIAMVNSMRDLCRIPTPISGSLALDSNGGSQTSRNDVDTKPIPKGRRYRSSNQISMNSPTNVSHAEISGFDDDDKTPGAGKSRRVYRVEYANRFRNSPTPGGSRANSSIDLSSHRSSLASSLASKSSEAFSEVDDFARPQHRADLIFHGMPETWWLGRYSSLNDRLRHDALETELGLSHREGRVDMGSDIPMYDSDHPSNRGMLNDKARDKCTMAQLRELCVTEAARDSFKVFEVHKRKREKNQKSSDDLSMASSSGPSETGTDPDFDRNVGVITGQRRHVFGLYFENKVGRRARVEAHGERSQQDRRFGTQISSLINGSKRNNRNIASQGHSQTLPSKFSTDSSIESLQADEAVPALSDTAPEGIDHTPREQLFSCQESPIGDSTNERASPREILAQEASASQAQYYQNSGEWPKKGGLLAKFGKGKEIKD